ncbi:ribose-phosphate diphosphokinase, partial [Mycobacterium tuberculosis]|nr:ribose-phosphate diphosphokinase [Mycobacterium tuberculosis]
PLAFVHKTRDITVPNQAVSKEVVGNIAGRTCVLIDDMIDTGGTIAGAVQVLKDQGAKNVIIAATHAVFSGPAVERLSSCGADEV